MQIRREHVQLHSFPTRRSSDLYGISPLPEILLSSPRFRTYRRLRHADLRHIRLSAGDECRSEENTFNSTLSLHDALPIFTEFRRCRRYYFLLLVSEHTAV